MSEHAITDEIEAFASEAMHASSTTRIWTILKASQRGSHVFWPIFQDFWNVCDDTWDMRSWILDELRAHGSSEGYLKGADAGFFASLPEQLTLYRGCSRGRVRGLSWTLRREVAEAFARGHRGIPVPNPVIATISFTRAKVVTVIADRGEDEIVLDPRRLPQAIKIEPYQRLARAA